MGKKTKRKFIDKNAEGTYSFVVVPRSLRDPKLADEDSSAGVLQPIHPPNSKQDPDALLPGSDNLDLDGQVDDSSASKTSFAELESYGIFYKDDYDYMQHLAPRFQDEEVVHADEKMLQQELEKKGTFRPKNAPLDASLFGSIGETSKTVEERIQEQGKLNLDWDPDVIAALEDDSAVNAEEADGSSYDDFFDMVINGNDDDAPGEYGGDEEPQATRVPDSYQSIDDLRGFSSRVRSHSSGDDHDDDDDDDDTIDGEQGERQAHADQAYENVWRSIGHGQGNADHIHDKFFGRGPGSDGEDGFTETRSKFTEYSMTSSVVPRSENMQNVDDHFEEFYDKYDEENIGALDMYAEDEDVLGVQDTSVLEGMLEELTSELNTKITVLEARTLAKSQERAEEEEEALQSNPVTATNTATQVTSTSTSTYQEGHHDPASSQKTSEDRPASDDQESDEDDKDDGEWIDYSAQSVAKQEWDCESILSTRSTLYNHPTTITEKSRMGKKRNQRSRQVTEASVDDTVGSSEDELDQQSSGIVYASTTRSKGESAEERKARKAAVKEQRRMRREQKKMHKLAFKEEFKRQQRA